MCVTVENSGSGLPPDFDPQAVGSLGLQIVHTLVADDLKGEMTIESLPPQEGEDDDGAGTRAIVTFPKRSLRVD